MYTNGILLGKAQGEIASGDTPCGRGSQAYQSRVPVDEPKDVWCKENVKFRGIEPTPSSFATVVSGS